MQCANVQPGGGGSFTGRGPFAHNPDMATIEAYVEAGSKRTFAGAIDWPGWARSGRTEDEALANLVAYRGRFADALRSAQIRPPASNAAIEVVERLAGGASTDYGVASVAPSADERPVTAVELDRQVRLMRAAWAAFDCAAAAAEGVELRTGPRGGGRDRAKMAAHIIEAEQAYIGQLGVTSPVLPANPFEGLPSLHEAAIAALTARANGELPDVGARGGRRWSARYFVRRTAWHALDHAWELEDRSV